MESAVQHDWWWDPWQRLGLTFPLSIGRENSHDDEDVTEELDEVRRKREEDQKAHPGEGALGVDQACWEHMGTNRRLFLMSLVHPFHGSTALMGVLMSSHHLATLCSFNDWACEGRKILEFPDEPGLVSAHEDPEEMSNSVVRMDHDENETARLNRTLEGFLEQYSEYWNLSRQVFFDKSPHLMLHVEAVHKVLESNPLPLRMQEHGITRLDTAYIMMWRPLCLRQLSRHERETPLLDAARAELAVLERSVELHEWLARRELPVLVLNLPKLIWQPQEEKHRIRAFLPCLRHLDEDYVPELGSDIFPGNQWKASGSVKSYGESVDPSTIGFDMKTFTCTGSYRYEEALTHGELSRARAAEAYLTTVS